MIKKLRMRFVLVTMLSTIAVLVAIVGGMNVMNYRQLQADADRTNKMITDNNGTFPRNDNRDGSNNGLLQGEERKNAPQPSGEPGRKDMPQPSGEPEKKDMTRPDGEPEQRGVPQSSGEPSRKDVPQSQNRDRQKEKPSEDMGDMSPEAPFETRYFSVVLDSEGSVTSSNLDNIAAVSEKQADTLAKKVFAQSKTRGFSGIYRFYKVTQSDGSTLIAFTDCNKALDTFYKNVRVSGIVSLAGVAAVLILVLIFSKLVFRPIEESYQKQKQFITDASHEIKTPLTIIDANVEVLEMMSGENKWTKSTKNQVRRLSSLAGQLITLSKMDEDGAIHEKMKFSMTDAVLDTASAFESVAKTNHRRISCDVEENIFFVGEEKRIREMLGIFLDNAVKYSVEDTEIHISLERKGRKIIYQITNATDQLQKGNQDVLFERFYRSDASRNSATGGSGIGLSVAKAAAEAHRGKLTAESKDGRSLTITLVLSPVA